MEAHDIDYLFEAPKQVIVACGDAWPSTHYRVYIAPDEACFYPYVDEVFAHGGERFVIFSNDWMVWNDLLSFPWRMRGYQLRFAALWRGQLYTFLPYRWRHTSVLHPTTATVPVIGERDIKYTPLGWHQLHLRGGYSLSIQYATRDPQVPLLTARKPVGPAIYLPPYLPHQLEYPERSAQDMVVQLQRALSFGLPVYTTWVNWYALAAQMARTAGWQVQAEDIRGELYPVQHMDYSSWRHAQERMKEFVEDVIRSESDR